MSARERSAGRFRGTSDVGTDYRDAGAVSSCAAVAGMLSATTPLRRAGRRQSGSLRPSGERTTSTNLRRLRRPWERRQSFARPRPAHLPPRPRVPPPPLPQRASTESSPAQNAGSLARCRSRQSDRARAVPRDHLTRPPVIGTSARVSRCLGAVAEHRLEPRSKLVHQCEPVGRVWPEFSRTGDQNEVDGIECDAHVRSVRALYGRL